MALFPDLAGSVVFVSGGSRGIGAATCRAFAANGARVAVNGRDEAAIDAVVGELRESGAEAISAPGDCRDAAALAAARDRVYREFGPVRTLVAFAGGGRQPQAIVDITEDEWRADIDGNLTATFLTVKAFLPAMLDAGGGSIVTMASAAARRPGGAPVAYAAAKAGIVNFTQQLAYQVAGDGVRANCLAPSTVLNERMREAIPADRQSALASTYPLGRLGVPDDVAAATLFLASDAASWITGVTLDIAGGQVMA